MKAFHGGVTAPKGFRANGLHCGIKRSGKMDLSLISSDVPACAAGVFTRNSIKAAPLLISMKHLKNLRASAIIANSGNANCFTGDFGRRYAQQTAALIGQRLSIRPEDVIVASTGIIGKPLPFKKIMHACDDLVKGLTRKRGRRAAQGILTTDTRTKEIAVRLKIGGKIITIGACAKGSGMIQPSMATMLAFITTDVAIQPRLLKKALTTAVAETFNMISVDGCMSTNDMVAILANGTAGNNPIDRRGKEFDIFTKALRFVCDDLAKKIVADGEGATKFLTIQVSGAKTKTQAKQAAMAIANSNLVKTAVHGSHPNWGRVAAAVGSLAIPGLTPEKLKMRFSPFKKRDIRIQADLNLGTQSAQVYTCDLTQEYLRINTRYN